MHLPGQEQLLNHTTLFGSHWIVAERSSGVCRPHWVGVARLVLSGPGRGRWLMGDNGATIKGTGMREILLSDSPRQSCHHGKYVIDCKIVPESWNFSAGELYK